MARIAPLNPENTSGRAADLFTAIKSNFGMVPNLLKTVGNNPSVLGGYLDFANALGTSTFDQATREALALTVAGGNGCDYCASAHTAASKALKVNDQEIERRLDGRSEDETLDALLVFTRKVLETKGFVSDADLERVRAAGYSDAQIIEVIGNVALNVFTNYVNHVAGTEIDFPKVSAHGHEIGEARAA